MLIEQNGSNDITAKRTSSRGPKQPVGAVTFASLANADRDWFAAFGEDGDGRDLDGCAAYADPRGAYLDGDDVASDETPESLLLRKEAVDDIDGVFHRGPRTPKQRGYKPAPTQIAKSAIIEVDFRHRVVIDWSIVARNHAAFAR